MIKIYDDNLFQLLKNYVYTGGDPETAVMAFTQMGWPEESVRACLEDVSKVAKVQSQFTNAFMFNYELYNLIVAAITKCQSSESADLNKFAKKLQGVASMFNPNDIMLQQKSASYGQSYPESGDDYMVKCLVITKLLELLNGCDCCSSCPDLKMLFDKCNCMCQDPSWDYKMKVMGFFDKYKRRHFDDRFVKQFKNIMISPDAANEYKKVLDMFSFMPECVAAMKELEGGCKPEETGKVNESENVNSKLANEPSNIDRSVDKIVVLSEQEKGQLYFGLFGKCFAIDEKYNVKFADASNEFNIRNSNLNNMFEMTNEGLVSRNFDRRIVFDKNSEMFKIGNTVLKEGINPYWDLVRAGVRTNNAAEYSALTDIIANKKSLALLPVIFTESSKFGVKAVLLKESKTAIVDNIMAGEVKIVKCGSITELTENLSKNYGINVYSLLKESLGEESSVFATINYYRDAIKEAKSKIKALKEAKAGCADNNVLTAKLDECISMWDKVIVESEEAMQKVGTSNTYFVTYKFKNEQLPREETYVGNEFTTEDEIINKYDLKGFNVEWYDIQNAAAKPNTNIQAITNGKTAEQEVNIDANQVSQNGAACAQTVADANKQSEKGSSAKAVSENVEYDVEIVEKGNPHPLKTRYIGDDNTTEQDVIAFFGLKEDDVESFNITKKQI